MPRPDALPATAGPYNSAETSDCYTANWWATSLQLQDDELALALDHCGSCYLELKHGVASDLNKPVPSNEINSAISTGASSPTNIDERHFQVGPSVLRPEECWMFGQNSSRTNELDKYPALH